MTASIHEDGALRLEVEDGDVLTVRWLGKSTAREPGDFILPVLTEVLERGDEGEREVVLDFRELAYLNSSTITPVIRVLERAKHGKQKVTVLYDKSLKWQSLSFSALEVFRTPDERIQIRGE